MKPYFISQQILMKRNHRSRKPKNYQFETQREQKLFNNTHSASEKQVLEALNSVEKMPIQQSLGRPRAKSFKHSKTSGVNLNMAVNYSFMDLGKEMRSKRTLIDENNQLKKKLESISSMKVSKRELVTKKMSTEFEKQLYWNGPQAHMITGVKNQYQKMKENYLKKCDEYEELLRSVAVSSTMQFMTYIQALELQNHILARKMQTRNKSLQNKTNEELQDITNQVLKDHNEKFDSRLQRWKQKFRMSRAQNRQLKSKIMFLQKLLIEKDNNQHNSKRSAKRLEREKHQLHTKCQNLELALKNTTIENTKLLENLKTNHAHALARQKQNQINYEKQQQQYIIRLQKENKYLQSLVQSWKEQKNPKKDHKKQASASKHKLDKSHHHPVAQSTHQEIQLAPQSTIKKYQKKLQAPFMYLHKQQSEAEYLLHQSLRRAPFSADKKNSENSVKNRIVQPHQIQQTIDYARCILIAKGLNIDWVLEQFQGDQDDWSKQYISMKQAREVCENRLQLSKSQSNLIARYLIQHSTQEHVYTDDLNEYERIIVKSIVKNLFGSYSVYQKEKGQFEQILQDWKSKLQWTLQNTTKGGLVSKDKFSDLMHSLNLNTPGFVPYCVSKMALHSQSLQKLRFSYLFSKVKKQ